LRLPKRDGPHVAKGAYQQTNGLREIHVMNLCDRERGETNRAGRAERKAKPIDLERAALRLILAASLARLLGCEALRVPTFFIRHVSPVSGGTRAAVQ
jgi:hypothetical protein